MSSLLGTSFNHPRIFIISATLKSPNIAPIYIILPFFIFASLLSTYSFFPLKPPDWFPKGLDPCHLSLNWLSLLVSDNLRNSLLNDCWLNEWMNLPPISLFSSSFQLPTDPCGSLIHSFINFSLHVSPLPNFLPSSEPFVHWWRVVAELFSLHRTQEQRQAAVAGTHLCLWNLNEAIISKLQDVMSLVHTQISFRLPYSSCLPVILI